MAAPDITRVCEGCGQPMTRRVRKKDTGRFCSKPCFGQWKSEQNRSRFLHLRMYRRCIEPAIKAAERARLAIVLPEVRALRRIAAYREKPVLFLYPCKHCSAPISVRRNGGLHVQVCDKCRDEQQRRLKRISRSARKARIRARPREAVDPIVVFERDGWTCRLCGGPTPRELRGTTDERAPELDHVLAIARGGAHTWANVQCTCRKCNRRKSDRLVEPMAFARAA